MENRFANRSKGTAREEILVQQDQQFICWIPFHIKATMKI